MIVLKLSTKFTMQLLGMFTLSSLPFAVSDITLKFPAIFVLLLTFMLFHAVCYFTQIDLRRISGIYGNFIPDLIQVSLCVAAGIISTQIFGLHNLDSSIANIIDLMIQIIVLCNALVIIAVTVVPTVVGNNSETS